VASIRTEKCCCSWLGHFRDSRISGGRILSSHSRHAIHWVSVAWHLEPLTLARSPPTITANARKLAHTLRRPLKNGAARVRQGMEDNEKNFGNANRAMRKIAAAPGFDPIARQQPAPEAF
jgi:hypothetical protein